MEQVYKPAWRSYYVDFALMLLLLICAGVMSYVNPGASWQKFMWIAVCVIDVLIFLYVSLRRSMMTLTLRDNPSDPANQEVSFSACNPLKPWSRDFNSSIEIGLANIMHIEVGQSLMQTILGIGDIVITSSGTGEREITAKNIPSPKAVRDIIQEHARNYRTQSN